MRKVALLSGIAAVLAVYLLLSSRAPEQDEGGGSQPRLINAFDRAAVRRIVITRQGAAPFSLERQPAGQQPAWKVLPGDVPAEAATVEDLLSAIEIAETTRIADVSAATAGLAPPKVTLEIDQPSAPVTVALGRPSPGGQGVYVRVGAAGAVRVAPRRLAELADRAPGAFRDRRVVPLAPATVSALSWRSDAKRPQRHLRLVAGRWQNGDEQAVSNERVTAALRQIEALRILRYVPPRAPSPAAARIELEGAHGATVFLASEGKPCAGGPGTFVGRDGANGDGLCVDAAALAGVWSALQAARAPDPRLVSAPPEAIKRVELSGPRGRLVLVRASPGSWRMEIPKVPYAIDPQAVDAWLSALSHVDQRPPARQAGRRVRHLIIQGTYREEATVSPGAPGYALLEPDPLRFRDRAVLDFAHFDARRLARTAAGRAVELASADGEDWRAIAPAGAHVDGTNTARVVSALGNLHAEDFLAKPPRGTPALTLEITIAPPGEPSPIRHQVELYKKKEAPGCAGRLDRGVAFTLAPAACADLRLALVK